MKIKAIDLFCGAGGVTRGLLNAGVDVVAGYDIDSSLKDVYEQNNQRENGENVLYIQKRVEQIKRAEICNLIGTKKQRAKNKEKFLLAGCAPCQPFSLKNKNRYDQKDDRRTLINYFANLIKETKPDFVFMENVAGIKRIDSENLKYFTDTLEEEGFYWKAEIKNAIRYGVPQNRKRFVLLASKESEIIIPDGDYDGINKPYKTVADAIKHLPKIKVGTEDKNITNHKCANLSDLNKIRIKATPKNGGTRLSWKKELWLNCHLDENGNPKKVHQDVYGRMSWDKPAPTLTTKFNSFTTGRYGHPIQNRAISLKEGALLQSFPENYIFYGNMQSIARQIGNAVPPKMAETFGKFFYNSIL